MNVHDVSWVDEGDSDEETKVKAISRGQEVSAESMLVTFSLT
jgi:hypothetical protein